MRAAFVYGPRDIRVEDAPVPELKKDEVLVRIKACGVCYSDVRFYLGLKKYEQTPFGRESPGFTGHEWAGEVVKIGGDVENISVGDRVVPNIIVSCGRCKPCREGRINLCVNKIFIHGGYAEYVKVPARNLLKIPKELSFEEAAVTEPLACCLNGNLRSNIQPGDDVVVIGDGFMGILNAQLAKLSGAKVAIIGHHDDRLRLAKEFGADQVINSRNVNWIKELRRRLGEGADVVIVAAGNKDAVEMAFKLVGVGGTINLFAGVLPPVTIELDPNLIHYGEIILTGSNVATPELFQRALKILSAKLIDVKPLLTHKFSLDEIREAFEAVERRRVIKAVIVP